MCVLNLTVPIGLMEWREDPESPYYNTDMIIYRVSHMNELYASQEFIGMASFLRTGMTRVKGEEYLFITFADEK